MRLERFPEPIPLVARRPHPVLGCLCEEGVSVEILGGRQYVVAWLPPVHDCFYIAARDEWLAKPSAQRPAFQQFLRVREHRKPRKGDAA